VSSSNDKPTLAARYAAWVMRNRILVVLVVLVSTLLASTQIQYLDVRNDPDTLLPASNRYTATNAYGEQKFGMGNLMVLGFILKEPGDIYQPWFVNLVKDIHEKMIALPNSRPNNFMDLAAQKIKYMGASNGSLVFKRLIPVDGISSDPAEAKDQLAFLKEGLENNPVMAPMLLYMEDAEGNRCVEYQQPGCTARGTFIIGDYDDGVKEKYLPWVRQVIAIADEVKAEYGDRLEIRVAGEPYFLAYMLYDLVEKWWLFVISIAIVFVILWWQNKGWRGAVFPLIGVFATIAMTIGLMGFTAFKLTTMMVLTPMLLLAIGTGHAVQVTKRYMTEMLETQGDTMRASEAAIAHTIIPATLAIITDMAGFATLASVDISFYKDYAYFGMFGMATLLITTTTMIPILMSYFPPRLDPDHKDLFEPSAMENAAASKTTALIVGPGKWAIMALVGGIVLISAHLTDIKNGTWEDLMPGVEKGINYSRAAFKESSPTIEDITRLGEVMPGVISVNIPLTSKEPLAEECTKEFFPEEIYDIYEKDEKKAACKANEKRLGCWDSEACGPQGIMNDVEVMAAVEKMENWMRTHPSIGFTGSYVQYIRLVNMLLSSKTGSNMDLFNIPTEELIAANMNIYGDPEDPEYVPDPDFIVQNFNGLLEVNVSDGDLDAFIDPTTWNEAIIMGFVNTMDPVLTHQVVEDIHAFLDEHKDEPGFNKIKFGLNAGETVTMPETGEVVTIEGDPNVTTSPGLGGFLGATEASREVSWDNWLLSPMQTALAILIISALMFRSISVAIALILMLFITLFAQYGMGAYFTSIQNWSGNLAFHLLVTLSISMGLGVDYSIYLVSRLREEYIATAGDWAATVYQTLRTTGGAVLASVIVLLGSFIPLVSTQLANTWGLGMYIGQALIIDVITAFTFLPILIYWMKPNYVFKAREA
jgi:predicted RND superfamily exporter protein